MLESTKQLISTLFSSVVTFLKGVQVPGMKFSFLTLIIGVFLFAMLSAFLIAFFGFGGQFSPAELGAMTRDKITARKLAVYDTAAEMGSKGMLGESKRHKRRMKRLKRKYGIEE